MAEILDCRKVVASLNESLENKVIELNSNGVNPKLAIIRVGDLKSNISYERGAEQRCFKLGIQVEKTILSENETQENLIQLIKQINIDDTVHGVLLLRPLPKHIDENMVRNYLAPEKDVDGITDRSIGSMIFGTKAGFPPCTPRACLEILDYYKTDLKGKNIAMVGCSLVVGRPLAMLLLNRNATVFMCHEFTKDVPKICRESDIIIAAAGKAGLIGKEHVRENQIVIDVGININNEGHLCGDVDFEAVEGIVKSITPVPGGVGIVTTSILAEHVIKAAKRKYKANF